MLSVLVLVVVIVIVVDPIRRLAPAHRDFDDEDEFDDEWVLPIMSFPPFCRQAPHGEFECLSPDRSQISKDE